MPYILMTIFVAIFIASYVFPIKWVLETDRASTKEKALFIVLMVPLWIFTYYLFYAYVRERYRN